MLLLLRQLVEGDGGGAAGDFHLEMWFLVFVDKYLETETAIVTMVVYGGGWCGRPAGDEEDCPSFVAALRRWMMMLGEIQSGVLFIVVSLILFCTLTLVVVVVVIRHRYTFSHLDRGRSDCSETNQQSTINH